MPLRELAKAADMAPGKAHPYLVSFGKLGLVTQEASTGYYWLGPTAMQLGLVTLRMLNPVREATPFAESLARETGHSVALSVWGNQGPTVVFLFDAIYPLHTNIRTGTVMSLAGTATGRLFAAYLPAKLNELEARNARPCGDGFDATGLGSRRCWTRSSTSSCSQRQMRRLSAVVHWPLQRHRGLLRGPTGNCRIDVSKTLCMQIQFLVEP